MTNFLNTVANHWFDWQVAMLWQTAVLIAIIWIVDVCIRKWAHPQVRYALWMLVLVKLLIPPTWTSPASVTSHIPGLANRAATVMSGQGSSGILPESKVPSEQSSRNILASEGNESQVSIQPSINHPGLTATPPSKGGELLTSSPLANLDLSGEAEAGRELSWQVYAMFAWLAGMTVLSLWLMMRLSSLRKQHLKCHPGLDRGSRAKSSGCRIGVRHDNSKGLPERFYQQLEAVAAKLGLKRLPRVVLTDKVACPAVFGVFRPVLLMPAKKFENMTHQDTEHILLHELAHIKRGDLLVHAVWMLAQIVYWFNPLLWMIRRTLQNLRELCCDATVAKLLRDKTVHYRQTLLETARQLLAEPVDPGLGLLGLFENNNWLVTRLQWLEKNTWKNRPLRIATIIALVAVMTTCVLPMANRPKKIVAEDTENKKLSSITGHVKDADDNPLSGFKFTMVGADGSIFKQVVTDKNGRFEINSVPNKTYRFEHQSDKGLVLGAWITYHSSTPYTTYNIIYDKDKNKFIGDIESSSWPPTEQVQNYTATLANGVTVELLGVCEHPNEGKQWWSPDGTVLDKRPYQKSPAMLGTAGYKNEYLFRVTGTGDSLVKVKSAPPFSGGMGPRRLSQETIKINDPGPKSLYSYVSVCDQPLAQADITMLIGKESDWITESTLESPSETSSSHINDIIITAPVEKEGQTHVNVIAPAMNKECRIIAIDNDGKMYIGNKTESGSTLGNTAVTSINAQFPLPLNRIKSIECQTQVFTPVTFKNVALRPGGKTEGNQN